MEKSRSPLRYLMFFVLIVSAVCILNYIGKYYSDDSVQITISFIIVAFIILKLGSLIMWKGIEKNDHTDRK